MNPCQRQIKMQRINNSNSISIDKASSDTLSTYFKDNYPDEKHC